MADRYRVGQRVTVTAGPYKGARGRIAQRAHARIAQRAHADVRPILTWLVRFDEPVSAFGGTLLCEDGVVSERSLAPDSVPESARPVSVGALFHPERGRCG